MGGSLFGRLARARAELKDTRERLETTEQQRDRAENNLARTQAQLIEARKAENTARKELEVAKGELEVAKGELRQARDRLRQAGAAAREIIDRTGKAERALNGLAGEGRKSEGGRSAQVQRTLEDLRSAGKELASGRELQAGIAAPVKDGLGKAAESLNQVLEQFRQTGGLVSRAEGAQKQMAANKVALEEQLKLLEGATLAKDIALREALAKIEDGMVSAAAVVSGFQAEAESLSKQLSGVQGGLSGMGKGIGKAGELDAVWPKAGAALEKARDGLRKTEEQTAEAVKRWAAVEQAAKELAEARQGLLKALPPER
jgi:chromosome segregation ATPase